MRRRAAFAYASLSLGLAAILVAFGSPLSALAQHGWHRQADSSKLVEIVRDPTQQYQNVANATGFTPALGCISGPGHGAMGDMGVHLVDLVRWTCGDFARVAAHAGIAYPAKPVAGTTKLRPMIGFLGPRWPVLHVMQKPETAL